MRIHLVTDQFSIGGGIEHIYQLVTGLKEFQFKIFGNPGPAVEKFNDLPNVTTHDKGNDPGTVIEESPDLVHIHHLKPLVSFFKNPLNNRYSMPIFYTAHGLHIHKFEFYRSLIAKLKYFLRFRLEKGILPNANRIIAVSREDKQFMENKFDLTNVTYLTNGIDFKAVQAGQATDIKNQLTQELHIPPGSFLFVTAARFNFQKGYDILVKAIAKIIPLLEKNERPIRFLFAGDGPEFEQIKALSERLKVSRYIRFMGSRNDVYDILHAGDVCVLPSRWEGLPIVLLETGLLKTPVIASDTYGNREIIGKSNGILFKNLDCDALAQTLTTVIDQKYDLDTFAENMFKEVRENYNLDKMLTGLKSMYSMYLESINRDT
jgi:glycosyltransferase involved in cell wall biosynthesis